MNLFENFEIIYANAEDLKKDMINKFQELSGRMLSESSPETLIFSSVAYALGLREELYNDDAKQKYLKFARGERLDLQGEIYGKRGERLKNQSARATFRFYISAAQATDTVVSKGSLIKYNELYFETDDEYKISKGKLFVEGIATCKTSGLVGNSIPVGQINVMVDLYPYFSKVENITVSNGGTDEEDDETYRERIRSLPESFTVAGSSGAYEFWVKSTSQEIIDVKIVSEKPCEVDIYPWTRGGLATAELKEKILKTTNSEFIRPLTDKVSVKDPTVVEYNIQLNYYVGKENESFVSTIKDAVKLAIDEYNSWQKERIGRDINPDELIKKMKMVGVKRVEITSPAFRKLESKEVGVVKDVTVNYQGVEDI